MDDNELASVLTGHILLLGQYFREAEAYAGDPSMPRFVRWRQAALEVEESAEHLIGEVGEESLRLLGLRKKEES